MPHSLSPIFKQAIVRFDAENAQDPNTVSVKGQDVPHELAYAKWLSAWVVRLNPEASEALRLAARCQHLRRWDIPRDTYPNDRAGYLKWRKELYGYHAKRAGEILSDVGYDDELIGKVQSIVRKENLRANPDAQTMEDALCLVFLEHQFAELSERTSREKMIEILKRTWGKMSDRGHEEAMALDLSDELIELVREALG